jgi:epoxyqueuosine reductase
MMHLGELVIDDEVDEYDAPMSGVGCGSCRACIEACPNGAIRDNRTIDTRRCISCRTIEREAEDDLTPLHGWIFGCDACQTVCPFNRHAPLHANSKFDPIVDPAELGCDSLMNMTEERFAQLVGHTAMMRAGLMRLRNNALRNANERD